MAGGGPRVGGVLETCLYVDDMAAARGFYEGVLGCSPILAEERIVTYAMGPASVLILFLRGGTLEPIETPGGTIPPHDGNGPMHIAFAVAEDDLKIWRARLAGNGTPVESEVTWKQGGTSLYLRDPARNLVELASPGLWPNYPRDLR